MRLRRIDRESFDADDFVASRFKEAGTTPPQRRTSSEWLMSSRFM
jgi:hypothetical protein